MNKLLYVRLCVVAGDVSHWTDYLCTSSFICTAYECILNMFKAMQRNSCSPLPLFLNFVFDWFWMDSEQINTSWHWFFLGKSSKQKECLRNIKKKTKNYNWNGHKKRRNLVFLWHRLQEQNSHIYDGNINRNNIHESWLKTQHNNYRKKKNIFLRLVFFFVVDFFVLNLQWKRYELTKVPNEMKIKKKLVTTRYGVCVPTY